MACEKPNYFIDLGLKENGKHNLKMLPPRVDFNYRVLCETYGDRNILVVPCGKCPSCQKAYRRMWSLRCEAEARLYEKSSFITLTLDNKHVTNEVKKDHLKTFIKALRNRGIKVRYFACGEYGRHPLTGDRERPHYHIIIFGYVPEDIKPWCKGNSGEWQYTSKFINDIWQKGFATVGIFKPEAAGYVAGYVDKKETEEDGFLMMSTRPGLGYEYYRKNMAVLAEFDLFVSQGGFAAALPRYFEKAASDAFYDIEHLKANRMAKALKMSLATAQEHGFSNMEDVYKYQGEKERRKKKYARNL